MENIFTTLYKYKPQPDITPVENFFTESFKVILSLDTELLNKFVKYISNDQKLKPPFTLESQVRYGNSIIDLQITDKNYKKIFIEVKVNAHENRYLDEDTNDDFGQVEKYLRMNKGFVCFITKDQSNIEVKSNKDKFLGQFEWFEIYKLIDEYLQKNKLDKIKKYFINNFLKFMKELNMQPFQGFSQKDIAISNTNFLGFHDKLLSFLELVEKDKKIKSFCKKHKLKAMFKSPKFDSRWHLYFLKLGREEWGWHKRIELGFLENEEQNNDLCYYQTIAVWGKDLSEKFKKDIKRLTINKTFFINNPEADINWPVYKEICFSKFFKSGNEKNIKNAINFIYNSLLELEKSGVMDVLKKVR